MAKLEADEVQYTLRHSMASNKIVVLTRASICSQGQRKVLLYLGMQTVAAGILVVQTSS